jgi:hypothetical protein
MGNNQCKTLGIKPGIRVGTNEFNELWMRYDKNKSELTHKMAIKFLKDFAQAAKVTFSEDTANQLVYQCDQNNTGKISYEAFKNLFYSAVSQGGINLTASLAGQLRPPPPVISNKINLENIDEADQLREIIKEGDIIALKQFITNTTKDCKIITFNGPQITQGNFLHQCCRMAQYEMVKYLVNEKDFNVNIKDQNGTQPLYLACCAQVISWRNTQQPSLQLHDEPEDYKIKRRKVVKFLLKKGADLNSRGCSFDKKIIYSPIYAAAHTDDLELITSLVESGIPLSLGISPIFNAIIGARVEIVQYLLSKIQSNELDSNGRDMYDRTPLDYAQLEYNDELVETQCGGGKGTLQRNQAVYELLRNQYEILLEPLPTPPIFLQITDVSTASNPLTEDTSSEAGTLKHVTENDPSKSMKRAKSEKSRRIEKKVRKKTLKDRATTARGPLAINEISDNNNASNSYRTAITTPRRGGKKDDEKSPRSPKTTSGSERSTSTGERVTQKREEEKSPRSPSSVTPRTPKKRSTPRKRPTNKREKSSHSRDETPLQYDREETKSQINTDSIN